MKRRIREMRKQTSAIGERRFIVLMAGKVK